VSNGVELYDPHCLKSSPIGALTNRGAQVYDSSLNSKSVVGHGWALCKRDWEAVHRTPSYVVRR